MFPNHTHFLNLFLMLILKLIIILKRKTENQEYTIKEKRLKKKPLYSHT